MDDLFDELMGVLGDEALRDGAGGRCDASHSRQEPRFNFGLSPEPEEHSRYRPMQNWEGLSRFSELSPP